MEVKPGYKQTEVGVIPEEWETKFLREVVDFTNGRPHEKDIRDGGRYLLITLDSIDIHGSLKEQHKETDAWDDSLKRNDVVAVLSDLAHGNLLGLCDVIPEDERYVLNQRMGRLRRRIDGDSQFIRLQVNRRQYHFKARGQGTSQRHIYKRDFGALQIPVPSPNEQRAIAAALGDADALLGGLDRLIVKKRDLKQAATQQLLTGQTRLPGFHGDWEVTRLGDVATCHKGKGLPKSALMTNGSEPCVHYGELFTRYGVTIRETISRTNKRPDEFRSVANDVLMPTSDVTPRGLAKASCVAVDDVVLGGDILIIRTDPALISGTFLSHVIRRDDDQVLRLVTGTTVFHLYGADMKKFTFKRPRLAEQQAIVAVLSDMDAEFAALEARRDKARDLKQAMMQELLTGKTRLVPPVAAHA